MFARKRFFAWAAIALFLGSQLLVAQHDAQYGPEKHQHKGHDCEIQLLAEHAKSPSLPSAPAIPVPVVIASVETPAQVSLLTEQPYQPAQPRAPPISIA